MRYGFSGATGNAVACRYAAIRRTATESISRVMPQKNMLTPTSVPIAQIELIAAIE